MEEDDYLSKNLLGDYKSRSCFLVFLIGLFLFANANFVYAYSPPIYIANPETLECRYYFAGEADCFNACMNECQDAGYNEEYCFSQCADPCHYNPRPEGFTADIGETTKFSNQSEACERWKGCINKKGVWNSTSLKCRYVTYRATKKPDYSLFSFVLLLIILIIAVLIYIKIKKIYKATHEIHAGMDKGRQKEER
jgi:hypothetical protein